MFTPSSQLLKDIRAQLIAKGTSFNAVCKKHGLHRQAIAAALIGDRRGPKSIADAETFLLIINSLSDE